MAYDVTGRTVGELYTDVLWHFSLSAKPHDSRNGPVLSVEHPFSFCLTNPRQRCLIAPLRRPNPVFHVMEAIWMLAGEERVNWLVQFNKGIANYAEDTGRMHGAYGMRWQQHFGLNQLHHIAARLLNEKDDRQAVLTMWSPSADLPMSDYKDRPCNTHIYLRIVHDRLNMTVCNRSNDLFWGMLGSNIVHFTMLQEVMAEMVERTLGVYTVFTNNLHVYPNMVAYEALSQEAKTLPHTEYNEVGLIAEGENVTDFMLDCRRFVEGRDGLSTHWFRNVALPMKLWYLTPLRRGELIDDIQDESWQEACRVFARQ